MDMPNQASEVQAYKAAANDESHVILLTESETESHTSDSTGISIESHIPLTTSIGELLDGLPPISPICCISRVSAKFRAANEKAYTPQMVSIGPLHHGKKELQAMEEHKLRYLQEFISNTNNKSLVDCVKVVKECEVRARSCYAETINLSSDDFSKMLLVDGCYIIMVIWRFEFGPAYDSCGFLGNPDMLMGKRIEMILLENQLPFFVLESLFDLMPPCRNTFLELCVKYFYDIVLTRDSREKLVDHVMGHLAESHSYVKHLLDLLRICHLPSEPQSKSWYPRICLVIPKVTELDGVGMRFKRGDAPYLVGVKYTAGLLEIPRITIQDISEILLRNMLALENFLYPFDSYIIDYVFFMDMLVDTGKDVDLLVKNGIVENLTSDSAAVANMFNNLNNENTLWDTKYHFHDISENLNAYSNVTWHKWKATFRRDYCRTPWMIASTIVAAVFLVLTFIQTVCSIISV